MENNNNLILETTKKLLDDCIAQRKKLNKKDCIYVVSLPNPKVKDYLINFTNCCYNRMIDIFDDTIFLLNNGRIQSACSISRAMIETHAFLLLTIDKVQDLFEKENITRVDFIKTILESTNSSRIKTEEQKKYKEGKLIIDKYKFTPEAKNRIINMEALNTNIMDALRHLYKQQVKAGITTEIKSEASSEQIYNLLSEWVHPSQISLFTNYVKETHEIPYSLGKINIFDHAKYLCAQALSHICLLEKNYQIIIQLSEELPL